jgi:hypothetical protein
MSERVTNAILLWPLPMAVVSQYTETCSALRSREEHVSCSIGSESVSEIISNVTHISLSFCFNMTVVGGFVVVVGKPQGFSKVVGQEAHYYEVHLRDLLCSTFHTVFHHAVWNSLLAMFDPFGAWMGSHWVSFGATFPAILCKCFGEGPSAGGGFVLFFEVGVSHASR